jgi:hypothetical protein
MANHAESMENRKPCTDRKLLQKQRLLCFSFQGLRFTLKNLTTKSHKTGAMRIQLPIIPLSPPQHTFL